MKKKMKKTSDKEYLRKVLDKADHANHNARNPESSEDIKKGAKGDRRTAFRYLLYLTAEAANDEEFAEDLTETFTELLNNDTKYCLQRVLRILVGFLDVASYDWFEPDGGKAIEGLEKDFEIFFNRLSIEEVREDLKVIRGVRQALLDKADEERADEESKQQHETEKNNLMFG